MNIQNILKKSYVFGLIGALTMFSGCEPGRVVKKEISDILHEDATVSETVYSPSRHGSGSGMGPTIDFDGNIGLAFTSTTINIPEKYAVVFKCQHGKFIIEGADNKYKELWNRFGEGDLVDVIYREVYNSTYEDKDGDGKKDLIERSLIDYDFIDALPKNKELKVEKEK